MRSARSTLLCIAVGLMLPCAARAQMIPWTSYEDIGPTLLAYETTYPNLCRRYDLGQSVEGRSIWAIRITDNVADEEDEPEFAHIGGIHGDEVPPPTLCMLFIHELLTQYGIDPRITQLVDEVDVWVVPLMNPDGYDRVNRSRTNANGVNLDRDFPAYGDEDSPIGRQPETQAIMNWSAAQSLVASANYHAGALVVSYPLNTNDTGSIHAPDADVLKYISEQYSQHNPPMWNGDFEHGVTNAAAWFPSRGAMKDWQYLFRGCNEIVVEIHNVWDPPESEIPALWADNREAILALTETTLIGVRGIVTDADTGQPLAAMIAIEGRDHLTLTDPDAGDYHHMLLPGAYTLSVAADGHDTLAIPITVNDGAATRLDIQLPAATTLLEPAVNAMLPAGVPTRISWTGSPDASYQVQFTQNHAQTIPVDDGFEQATLGAAYATGGDATWSITTDQQRSGTSSARAGTIGDYELSWMERTVGGGALSFWYRISSHEYDWFNCYIDGQRVLRVSGETDWQLFATGLLPGEHLLRWEYSKNMTQAAGADTVWIDDLEFYDDITTWITAGQTAIGDDTFEWTPSVIGTDHRVRVRAIHADGVIGAWATSAANFGVGLPGDLNCDGSADIFDIDAFVLAIIDVAAYDSQYPACGQALADCNGDGAADIFDIDAFVAKIISATP